MIPALAEQRQTRPGTKQPSFTGEPQVPVRDCLRQFPENDGWDCCLASTHAHLSTHTHTHTHRLKERAHKSKKGKVTTVDW